MEISILGWKYENIRRFNNLEIDLTTNEHKLSGVSLIMMRNGTGKTTTIQLIRAVLNGSATSWSASKIREYKPQNSAVESGKFDLRVRFDGDLYYYSLVLDYSEGKAIYRTSRVSKENGGLEEGRSLPSSLSGVFDTEEFVNRFIFDGEQARKTLSTSSNEAENAVKYLYRVDKLDDIQRRIDRIVSRKQAEGARGATAQSVKNTRTRMENKESKYYELVTLLTQIENDISQKAEKRNEYIRQKSALLSSDERIREKVEALKAQRNERHSDLVGYFATIKARMREPYRVNPIFDHMLQELANHMQTLKLPKTTAREFFRELAEKPHCICGREIGEHEKACILENAEEYLGEEDLVAINAIKDRIRNYQLNNDLSDAIADMCSAKEDLEDIEGTMQRLTLQLNETAQREAEELDLKIKRTDRELDELKAKALELKAPTNAPGATDQNNIALAKKAFEDAEEKYNTAIGTYEFTKKAQLLKEYIDHIKAKTLLKLKKTIVQKTNDKIEQILTDEHITVERIDGNLVLENRAGASEGQTLAIAYAYICSLFEHSSYEFPFVVDSPAASMDLDVRREVATVIPKMFKQLIIFVTSGEIAGFAERMYTLDSVSYYTIEGEHSGMPAKCTIGKDYFSTYQSEEDE